MFLCRRWIANVWIAGFAGALALSSSGCGSSSGKPTPDATDITQNDGAGDGTGADHAADGRMDTAASDATSDAALDASDGATTSDAGTHDASMEVGASCTDNARNGDETDIDCGGSCGRCGVGKVCQVNADCASGACNGSHICVECATAANCPGQDTECSARACLNGACVVALVASGTVLQTQVAGDCRSRRCDGQGQVTQVNDDTDVPTDGNPCTRDVCTSGAPSNPPASSSTTCGTNQLCDGLGHCVGCLTGADCPGTDNECRTRTCVQNLCGFTYRAAGTPTASQTTGDCKLSTCDGNGNVVPANLDTDLPSDGNPCTADQCAQGTPSFSPLVAGASCGGANICDGAGNCVQCVTAANCPGTDTDCQMRTCDSHGACGRLNVTAGTPTETQVKGDCKVRQCNGTGSVVIATDNSDVPTDNNTCTDDVCQGGGPANPARPVGTACGTGGHCDATEHCVGCVTAADCPAGSNPCQAPTCVNGACGTSQIANGTPVVSQVSGDCQVIQCDGAGNPHTVVDDTDLPNDNNPCTNDVCMGGAPSHTPVDVATSCGGHNQCDGMGQCVGCITAGDCPGMDTVCQKRTCTADQVCGFANVDDGTLAGTQSTGDCQDTVCDGKGGTRIATNDNDTPEDNNPCTANSCNAGVASNPPLASGTVCPTGVCDGQGHCVTCVKNSDCGVDTVCLTHACDAAHSCRIGFVEPGSPQGVQVTGDCQVQQCDGAGLPTSVPDNTDVPADDGNPCTLDVCDTGAPSHPPVAAGTLVGMQVTGDCSVVQCDGNGAVVSVASSTDVPADDGNPCTDEVCQGQTPVHPPKAAGTSCGGSSVCDGNGNCGPPPAPDAGAPDAASDALTTSDAAANRCPSPNLFCDDFEDGNATGWTPLEQTTSTPGTWMTVTETGHAGSSTIDLQGTGPSTSYHYDFPSVTAAGGPWADQTVSVWIKPTATALSSDNNKVGVCARFSTGGNNTTTSAYCLFLRSDPGATNGRLQISKKVGSGSLSTVLSTTTSGFPPATIPLFALDTWYKVTLQVSGSTSVVLIGSINDVQLITTTDQGTAADGGVAVVTTGGPAVIVRGTTASFDDLRVSSP